MTSTLGMHMRCRPTWIAEIKIFMSRKPVLSYFGWCERVLVHRRIGIPVSPQ